MLRTRAFAASAFYAVTCRAVFLCVFCVLLFQRRLVGFSCHVRVVKRKILGYGDVFGTAFRAISASRATYLFLIVDYLRDLAKKCKFLFVKRRAVRHKRNAVFHLRDVGHSAENSHYVFQSGDETQRPARLRPVGVRLFEQFCRLFGKIWSVPPLTGSITITFLPCLTAVS